MCIRDSLQRAASAESVAVPLFWSLDAGPSCARSTLPHAAPVYGILAHTTSHVSAPCAPRAHGHINALAC
eukprot:10242616-Alexandrium_andersonii.AAC.1